MMTGLFVCALSVGSTLAQAAPVAPARSRFFDGHETVKVAEGIYAFVAPEARSGVVQGNAVIVIGEDGVLAVDSGQVPSLTRRMIAEIRTLTDKPVRVLANTHWHGDHLLGNAEYRKAFSGVVVLAHAETRRFAGKNYVDFAAKMEKTLPEVVQEHRAALQKGKTKEGRTLSDEDREYLQVEIADIESILPELHDSEYVPADVTFEQEVTVHLGKREVQVMHLGRGNTEGDVVVYVPDAKVLVTGDLVVNPTPYSFGSFLGEWIETLRKVIAMGATTIVPGHGPVMKDTAYIETVIGLLQEVRSQVQAAVKEGLSLEDTRKRVNLEDYRKRLAGEDLWRKRAFADFFVTPAVERAYKEAKGEPLTK